MKIWQNAEESISVSCKQGLQDEIGGKEEPIVQEVKGCRDPAAAWQRQFQEMMKNEINL